MGNSTVIRAVLRRRPTYTASINYCSSHLHHTSFPFPSIFSSPPPNSSLQFKSLSNARPLQFHFSSPHLQLFRRDFCSSSGASKIVEIQSEHGFESAMQNVQDKSLPTVFYFTAVWCGPCKLISPVIEDLSKKYPDVTIYKVDIDQVRRAYGWRIHSLDSSENNCSN